MTARAKSSPAPSAAAPVDEGRRRRARRGSGEQLRAEIIAATKELLAASADSEAVSIRAVADAVGVTSPSIYLHFADKDALIEAVVVDVFAELDAAMLAAGTAVDPAEGPLAVLCAYGLAYVRFAVSHPEHYRVATMALYPQTASGEVSHLDQILADSAFTHFMAVVSDCMDAGIFAKGDPVPVSMELWSAAHGIASLMITKPYLPWGDKEDFANRVLRAAALGRAADDLLGGDLSPADVAAWLADYRATRP
jgi:AcrR family transcriptional regulator